jgi:hypothetical protein
MPPPELTASVKDRLRKSVADGNSNNLPHNQPNLAMLEQNGGAFAKPNVPVGHRYVKNSQLSPHHGLHYMIITPSQENLTVSSFPCLKILL